MMPNEIYALDDLDEKPWYESKRNKSILSKLFPVLSGFFIDFNRARADVNNRFSIFLKICTPVGFQTNLACWALMFDGRPFGFFSSYTYFSGHSLDIDVEIFDARVYITDSTLWRAVEDLVCSYVNVDIPISDKIPLNLPVLGDNQALVFERGFPAPASVDDIVLVVPSCHRTQDGIVAFNALIYHRLLNELIGREGEEKLKQMDWSDESPIVEEMARIVLLSVPKGIEARAGSGTVKTMYGQQRLLAVLRLDSGTYGLFICSKLKACLQNYRSSFNIELSRLGESDIFGSAHERMKWMDEDPRRV